MSNPSDYSLLCPIPLVLHVLHVLFAHVARGLLPERDACVSGVTVVASVDFRHLMTSTWVGRLSVILVHGVIHHKFQRTKYNKQKRRSIDGFRRAKNDSNSERVLERGLHEPRRRSPHHPAEQRAANVTIDSRWSEELSVIEGVEGLQTKLQCP